MYSVYSNMFPFSYEFEGRKSFLFPWALPYRDRVQKAFIILGTEDLNGTNHEGVFIRLSGIIRFIEKSRFLWNMLFVQYEKRKKVDR